MVLFNNTCKMQVKYLWIASEVCDIIGLCRLPTEIVIRDLFYGRTRFKEFAGSPEGIPTNILTDRLERLLARGVIEQIPAEDGTKRLAYCLTKKGKALGPVLKAMRDWGLTWDKSTRVLA